MERNKISRALLLCGCAFMTGCAHVNRASLTPGAAKKHLNAGSTTQADVIETFGTPNVITQRNSQELWVYDKVTSRVVQGAIGIGGLGGEHGLSSFGGGSAVAGLRSTERSETTIMLIIYFDDDGIVADYKVTQTKF